MLHIDGSAKSGSGTIVRYAIALASLVSQDLHITNVRARRDKPGLRPQHLASVKACAEVCGAKVEGAKVDSMELSYRPGPLIKGGHYQWDIGTAGSTTLLTLTLLPILLFADKTTTLTITGGLFQDFAPSAHHIQHVLFPTLRRMGIEVGLEIVRPGYVPAGHGVIRVSIEPVLPQMKPLAMLFQGKVKAVNGITLSSKLKHARVSERMAEECQKVLSREGYRANIDIQYDETSLQPGACLALWAETETGCRLGADMAGKRGRTSEEIGRRVAHALLEDLKSGATVDRYLADQLIIYAALASGTTEYLIPRLTEHVDSNLWLVEKFGARTSLDGNKVSIEGIGHTRK